MLRHSERDPQVRPSDATHLRAVREVIAEAISIDCHELGGAVMQRHAVHLLEPGNEILELLVRANADL